LVSLVSAATAVTTLWHDTIVGRREGGGKEIDVSGLRGAARQVTVLAKSGYWNRF
jgi:hypothetical protein